jgi:DNA-binding response OmpR family regulator
MVDMKSGYRILVIDDDPIFVKTARAILESHGYVVDSAADGKEGLRRMVAQKPDLVLLDVMMGWPLEGVSVSREMMDQAELRRIPIVMVTSIRSSEYRGSFPLDEYLHIDNWLDKPFPPERLVAEVEATLARHEKYKENAAHRT